MHEMALAQGVLDVIEEQARRAKFSAVRTVFIEIGELSGVEPQAISFCFEAVTRGSVAHGARLQIVPVEGRGICIDCGEQVRLRERFDACPHCGAYGVQATAGTGMRVMELEVD